MRLPILKTMTVAATAAGLAASPALADRELTPEERERIEAQLRNLGYTSWEEIEWEDDGYWEVDDAERADGEDHELHLAPDTFEVIERDD